MVEPLQSILVDILTYIGALCWQCTIREGAFSGENQTRGQIAKLVPQLLGNQRHTLYLKRETSWTLLN